MVHGLPTFQPPAGLVDLTSGNKIEPETRNGRVREDLVVCGGMGMPLAIRMGTVVSVLMHNPETCNALPLA